MTINELFRIVTPLIYWLLVVAWMYILVFYLRRIKQEIFIDKMLSVLFIVLSLDAFRTLFESSYFGIWYTSMTGLINIKYYNFLAQPEIVFIPKLLNLIISFIIIIILIRKWIPQESERLKSYKSKIFNNEFIIDQIPISIVITDLDGKIEYVNEKFHSLTGYTLEEIKGKKTSIFNSKDKSVTDYDGLWNTILSGNKWRGQFYNQKKNGEYYWEDAIITPLADEEGHIENYLAIKEDITEKILLDNEKETLLTAIEQFNDTVEILDRDGYIQYVNKAFTKTTGYSKEEAIGKKPLDLFWDEKIDNKSINNELWEVLSLGKPWVGKFTNRVKDGSYIVEEVSISPVFDKKDRVQSFSSVKRNVTEQLKLEQEQKQIIGQLYHSQKLEAVGQLAGGAAHDFNNILNSIISAVTLLENKEANLDQKSKDYLSMIMTSASRATDLASNLLSVSRRGQSKNTSFCINDIIRETINILESSIDKRIKISSKYNNDTDTIYGDKSGFQNLLLNLGLNASYAISESGTIEFNISNIQIDEEYCKNSSFDIGPGKYCKINVVDTGCGISEEILPSIFDAFFTTREDGKGTGLGLSSTLRFIQDHNGEVTVKTSVNRGTVFCVLIPCNENQVVVDIDLDQTISSGVGSILLVDDEEFNRDLGKEILESIGYSVILASNGEEALEIYSKYNDKIDLIIMDMIMPIMDGSEAFMKIKENYPRAKIIIVSGFSEDEKIQKLKSNGLEFLISKPYKISEFSQIIHKVLN